MKIISYYKTGLLAILTASLSSCNFLEVVPEGNATVNDIYKTQSQAERMVKYINIKIYISTLSIKVS